MTFLPCTTCKQTMVKPVDAVADELLTLLATLSEETDDSTGNIVVRHVVMSTVDTLAWELKGRCAFCSMKALREKRKVAA